ncbi:hypothetical protein CHUAL_014117 [Chamberlinius hualienensis]
MATSTNDVCHQHNFDNNGRPQHQHHQRRHYCHANCCGGPFTPGCIFLTVTLLATATSSGLMVLALMTDFWEYVDFDPVKILSVADNNTKIDWLINNHVARLTISPSSHSSSPSILRVKRVFLVPMYGGVWTICINLNDKERGELEAYGYENAACRQYLSPEYTSIVDGPNDWMTRMQNLSISCAMVCLILLAASTLLGLFGLCKRQISAVLITGVIYILAAVFCTFTLSIMHFKRKTSKDCGLVDPIIPDRYQVAQLLSTGWSLAIGWVSVALCILTAFLWYILSKILRYGPISIT